MERLKRISAINVNLFLTKIDFHVAKNKKILTFPDSDTHFPDFFKIAVFPDYVTPKS